MATGPFDGLLGQLGSRLDEVRQHLYFTQARAQRSDGVLVARYSRAMAYVMVAASLEAFVNGALRVLCEEINLVGLAVSQAKLGIVSLEQSPRFDSVASSRKQRIWDERAALLQRADSQDRLVLNAEVKPMDGRTIKAAHLRTLWATFEIPGSPLPRPAISFTLEDLSEGRNAVAHGNTDPVSFGRRKPPKDVLDRIDQVEELAVHMIDALNDYVARQGFVR
jgi:hypothetical protein